MWLNIFSIYWQVLSFVPCQEYPAWLAGFWNVCLFWGSWYLMSELLCLIKMLLKCCFMRLFTFLCLNMYISYISYMIEWHFMNSIEQVHSAFLFPSSSNDILSLIAVSLIVSALVAKNIACKLHLLQLFSDLRPIHSTEILGLFIYP